MKTFDTAAFESRYERQIAALRQSLCEDFDTPAQRQINRMFESIGQRRFVGKDDRWEQIEAAKNGTAYERPPAHLIQRRASY